MADTGWRLGTGYPWGCVDGSVPPSGSSGEIRVGIHPRVAMGQVHSFDLAVHPSVQMEGGIKVRHDAFSAATPVASANPATFSWSHNRAERATLHTPYVVALWNTTGFSGGVDDFTVSATYDGIDLGAPTVLDQTNLRSNNSLVDYLYAVWVMPLNDDALNPTVTVSIGAPSGSVTNAEAFCVTYNGANDCRYVGVTSGTSGSVGSGISAAAITDGDAVSVSLANATSNVTAHTATGGSNFARRHPPGNAPWSGRRMFISDWSTTSSAQPVLTGGGPAALLLTVLMQNSDTKIGTDYYVGGPNGAGGDFPVPPTALGCYVTLIGAGGGGGSGGVDPAAVARSGGGGGAGGARIARIWVPASAFTTGTFHVSAGAGGVGGVGEAADAATSNAGVAGGRGGNSIFGDGPGASVWSYVAGGGNAGNAGGKTNAAASTAGAVSATGIAVPTGASGGGGGASLTSSNAIDGTGSTTAGSGAGGGGGGGRNVATANVWAEGGRAYTAFVAQVVPTNGVHGGNAIGPNSGSGGNGGAGHNSARPTKPNGGKGGRWGGGGGGGGAGVTSSFNGSGGDGGPGLVRVEWVF